MHCLLLDREEHRRDNVATMVEAGEKYMRSACHHRLRIVALFDDMCSKRARDLSPSSLWLPR
jgi:hypothetical protein